MLPRFLAMFCCFAFGVDGVRAEQESNSWEPGRTWVFVVGIIEWENPNIGSFPQANRQDAAFVNVLKERGVDESRIVYLKDREATTKKIIDQFNDFVRRPASGDTLILYYCGHGTNSPDHRQTYLASYDASEQNPGVRVGSFLVAIEKEFKGKSVIIAADHCCSGGIAESVKALKRSRTSYAVFCSAHVNSGSTAAWTFTENLVYAFSGEVFMDDNADGNVTIQEMAANTAEDMAFADNQMAQFTITGSFPRGLVLGSTKLRPKPKVGTRLEIESEGQWYRGFVVDTDDQRLLVHYYGFPRSDDEWVEAKRVRSYKPRTFAEGGKVKVLSNGDWYDGSIVRVRLGLHLVKFDGWDDEWNEWVQADRLQPMKRSKK